MTNDHFAELVRQTVTQLDFASPGLAAPIVKQLRGALSARGHGPGCHVGRADLEPQSAECVEWYAGQLLAIIDGEAWHAMNSAINVLDKFVPGSGTA